MDRYQLVDKRKHHSEDEVEEWSEMIEDPNGPYVLFSDVLDLETKIAGLESEVSSLEGEVSDLAYDLEYGGG